MPIAASIPPKKNRHPQASLNDDKPGDVPFWRCGLLLLLTLLMLTAYWINPPPNIPAQAGVIMTLPDNVKMTLPAQAQANFHGFNRAITEAELVDLPKDTGFARKEYDDFLGDNIFCTIVLSGAEQRSIHRPEACLPGQGWRILGQDNLPIRLDSGRNLVVRNLTIQHDAIAANNEHLLVNGYFMYWFVGEDVTTPSHFTRYFLSSWDRFAHNRVHRWAYVSILSQVTDSIRPNGLGAEQTRTMLADFIRKIVPTFQKSEMPDSAPK